MNSSGWSQTLCKEEKIENTIGDNDPEVSVNEIRESVRGNPGFTPVATGDNEPEVSVMRSEKVYGGILVLLLLPRETMSQRYL